MPPQISRISCHFVLSEAVSQTKYCCLLKAIRVSRKISGWPRHVDKQCCLLLTSNWKRWGCTTFEFSAPDDWQRHLKITSNCKRINFRTHPSGIWKHSVIQLLPRGATDKVERQLVEFASVEDLFSKFQWLHKKFVFLCWNELTMLRHDKTCMPFTLSIARVTYNRTQQHSPALRGAKMHADRLSFSVHSPFTEYFLFYKNTYSMRLCPIVFTWEATCLSTFRFLPFQIFRDKLFFRPSDHVPVKYAAINRWMAGRTSWERYRSFATSMYCLLIAHKTKIGGTFLTGSWLSSTGIAWNTLILHHSTSLIPEAMYFIKRSFQTVQNVEPVRQDTWELS